MNFMDLKKGDHIEMQIEDDAFQGAGIGKYQGFVVFVPFTVAGDFVSVEVTKIKKKHCEAKLLSIIKPSSDRVDPMCKYFTVCGGCQLQFVKYQKQLEMKKKYVIDSFKKIGEFENADISDVIPCDESYYYRNKMEFSFGFDVDFNFALGMHLPNRIYDILDLDDCKLQSEVSNTIVNYFRELSNKNRWLPYKFSDNTGFLKNLIVRQSKTTGDILVNLLTSEKIPYNLEEKLILSAEKLSKSCGLSSIVWSKVISKRGVPKKIEEKVIFGKNYITEKMRIAPGNDSISEYIFQIPASSFFQVNTLQAQVLYSKILELILDRKNDLVFDLFCGTGTIGMILSKFVSKVVGIEINPDSIKVAKENASLNKISNVDFICGDVFDVLKTYREKPSYVVLDPPRAGLTNKLIEKLLEYNLKEILYVSCNPATLARDCSIFAKSGYTLKKVVPVDMFPHTYHVENIAVLIK